MTAIDTLLFADVLPSQHDDLAHIYDTVTCLGGKGMITAITASALGCDVATFTLVGKALTYQNQIRRFLPKNFNTRHVQPWLRRNHRTWITISNDQHVYTFIDQSPINSIPVNKLRDSLAEFIANIDVLFITIEDMIVLRHTLSLISTLQLPVVSNITAPILLDPAETSGALLSSLVAMSHTIVVNEREAACTLAKLGVNTWDQVPSYRLREVVVTRGDEGGVVALAPFLNWRTYVAPQPPHLTCVVGAGDTFNGAYLKARFVDGLQPAASCNYAAQVASDKVAIRASSLL